MGCPSFGVICVIAFDSLRFLIPLGGFDFLFTILGLSVSCFLLIYPFYEKTYWYYNKNVVYYKTRKESKSMNRTFIFDGGREKGI